MAQHKYIFCTCDTEELLSKKEIKNKIGFAESLAKVKEIHLLNNVLYLMYKNKTLAYKNIHGSWGMPTSV